MKKAGKDLTNEELKAKVAAAPSRGNCALCHRRVSNYDYCYGCESFVCTKCSPIDYIDRMPKGPHHVHAHLPRGRN